MNVYVDPQILDEINTLLSLLMFIVVLTISVIFVRLAIWIKTREPWLFEYFDLIRHQLYPVSRSFIGNRSISLHRDIIDEISISERTYNFRLTEEAKQLIISPIVDAYEDELRKLSDWQFDEIWRRSLRDVMETIDEYESRSESKRYLGEKVQRVNSIAVLNAFKIRWCNIPPFCKAA